MARDPVEIPFCWTEADVTTITILSLALLACFGYLLWATIVVYRATAPKRPSEAEEALDAYRRAFRKEPEDLPPVTDGRYR